MDPSELNLPPTTSTSRLEPLPHQLVTFLIGFYALWTLRATVLYRIDESITSTFLRAAYSDLLKLLVWVVPAVLYSTQVRKANVSKYLGVTIWPNRRNWLVCLSAIAIFLFLTIPSSMLTAGRSLSVSALSALPPALWLLQVIISPLLEEILFRGLVLSELRALVPTYAAIGLSSLLFVGAHLPFWLSHVGLTAAVFANAGGLLFFGLLAGWLFARTGSIWPPTLAHIANNVLASMLGT
jgi:membrane protease YdiL (CAAX protease family)